MGVGNVIHEISSITFKPSERPYVPNVCSAVFEEAPMELWASGRISMPRVSLSILEGPHFYF